MSAGMRHIHRHGGRDRHLAPPDDRHGGPHPGPRGRRPFDYGVLRLVVLAMIAETPRHGYELMKAIEERMGGGYSPSPGVIYPTLAWLEDMGYAIPEAEAGRKRYRITPEGAAFLAANRATLDAIGDRIGGPRGRRNAPGPILDAMRDLKQALRHRFLQDPVAPETIERIATAIAAATAEVETSMPIPAPEALLTSTAVVTTPKAAGYAAQLVKHFAHKIPARFEAGDGEIGFAFGTCRLHAEGDRLTLSVTGADPGAISRLQDVVARHLLRFAFREELAIDWQPAEAGAA